MHDEALNRRVFWMLSCALSMGLSLGGCRARQPPSAVATATTAPVLPAPVLAEDGAIDGNRWESEDGAAGFDVLAEFEPLTTDREGTARSGYLGRVGEALYFRSASGELLASPLGGSGLTLMARGVPERILVTGDTRATYWVTRGCEVFTPPARRLGSCTGEPEFVAVDDEFV